MSLLALTSLCCLVFSDSTALTYIPRTKSCWSGENAPITLKSDYKKYTAGYDRTLRKMQNLRSAHRVHPVDAGLVQIAVIEPLLCSTMSMHAIHFARAYSGSKLRVKYQSGPK